MSLQLVGVTQNFKGAGEVRSSSDMSYRNVLNPDVQFYLAMMESKNFLGGHLYLGKYWNGFTMGDMEQMIYADALRGIGYKRDIGKLTLGVDYAKPDFNPAIAQTIDDGISPTVVRVSAGGHIDDSNFLGAGYWHFDDYILPQTYIYGIKDKVMSRLFEMQYRHKFGKRWEFFYGYAHSNSDSENKSHIAQVRYKTLDLKKVGTYDIRFDYHYLGANTFLDPNIIEINTNDNSQGIRGPGFQFNVVPYENSILHLELNPWNTAVADHDTKSLTMRAKLNFWF